MFMVVLPVSSARGFLPRTEPANVEGSPGLQLGPQEAETQVSSLCGLLIRSIWGTP